ncbi:PREDICTED: uncharacterized protein LOC109185295 [Ipomoea nil]|uniref:uncharacterized protein LOC109185295 n=1 Tax=Ipomoea nil TaxID=35883 RepID=UPI00090116FA|nr:PREDICTED: uncharacterized protein LOC109185295 [Ipomoea nil]
MPSTIAMGTRMNGGFVPSSQFPVRHGEEAGDFLGFRRRLHELSFNRKIKSIQSDLGAEYNKLHASFVQLGIQHMQSCAYTHEQNGRVERKHRHIVETGIALLAHAYVSLKFGDFAFETAATPPTQTAPLAESILHHDVINAASDSVHPDPVKIRWGYDPT